MICYTKVSCYCIEIDINTDNNVYELGATWGRAAGKHTVYGRRVALVAMHYGAGL